MKRSEKADKKAEKDNSNGNDKGNFGQTILRNISKAFHINSIEMVDNCPYIYSDLGFSATMDDEVFINKEQEFAQMSSDPAIQRKESNSSICDDAKIENYSQSEDKNKLREEAKKEQVKKSRPRRASDVIDSIGEEHFQNLRRSHETPGITISSSRSRASSDLGYSGSYASSPAASYGMPTQQFNNPSRGINDVTDSQPFLNIHEGSSSGPETMMPVERDADEYNMRHSRRGRAIIINNDIFDNNLVSPRKGSDVDVENLRNEFSNLGFEVTVFGNLTYYEIMDAINSISKEDHSDADCLMVAVLTHGFDNGFLYAKDTIYSIDNLWLPFTADRCLSLAGKPKIFFIQACRGSKVDAGVTLVSRKGSFTETDAGTAAYKLPSHSDFLLAYSCPDGYYSWRNPEDGTWFVQSLVHELRNLGTNTNFLTLLTKVNRRVALQFSSYNEEEPWLHDKKQVSTFQSTLIRDLIFRPKKCV